MKGTCVAKQWGEMENPSVSSSLVLVPEAPVGNPYLPNGFVLPVDLMNRCISTYL